MNLNSAALLKLLPPIFNALDSLIENYGVYLYLVFVWLALAVIATACPAVASVGTVAITSGA